MHITDIAIGLLQMGDDRKKQWDKLPPQVQRSLLTKIVGYAHEQIQAAFIERGQK